MVKLTFTQGGGYSKNEKGVDIILYNNIIGTIDFYSHRTEIVISAGHCILPEHLPQISEFIAQKEKEFTEAKKTPLNRLQEAIDELDYKIYQKGYWNGKLDGYQGFIDVFNKFNIYKESLGE